MILAHTFLGRSDADHHVGDEEVFFLFCANQSCPVSYGNFLMWNLHTIALPSESIIHVGGTVTHTAIAFGLERKLRHLTLYCGYTLLDIKYFLDHRLMRWVSFDLDFFRLLIKNEMIHYFTLPDPTMTSVHDPAN